MIDQVDGNVQTVTSVIEHTLTGAGSLIIPGIDNPIF